MYVFSLATITTYQLMCSFFLFSFFQKGVWCRWCCWRTHPASRWPRFRSQALGDQREKSSITFFETVVRDSYIYIYRTCPRGLSPSDQTWLHKSRWHHWWSSIFDDVGFPTASPIHLLWSPLRTRLKMRQERDGTHTIQIVSFNSMWVFSTKTRMGLSGPRTRTFFIDLEFCTNIYIRFISFRELGFGYLWAMLGMVCIHGAFS